MSRLWEIEKEWEEKKVNTQWDWNLQIVHHKACTLPLCYRHCPLDQSLESGCPVICTFGYFANLGHVFLQICLLFALFGTIFMFVVMIFWQSLFTIRLCLLKKLSKKSPFDSKSRFKSKNPDIITQTSHRSNTLTKYVANLIRWPTFLDFRDSNLGAGFKLSISTSNLKQRPLKC